MATGESVHSGTLIARLFAFVAACVLIPAATSSALDPPPVCKDALWAGNTWGKGRLSQKVVNNGDQVTLTVDIVGGPPHGVYCGWGDWHPLGTLSVAAQNPDPSCFDIVDYSPKADSLHTVEVLPWGVHWAALSPNKPPNWVNEGCYCIWIGHATRVKMESCPADLWKTGAWGPGATFTVTLKAKCSRVDSSWHKVRIAGLSGDWAIGWSDFAEDYFKFGGRMAVSLTADPTVLPADGSAAALTARVFEATSQVMLPRQPVNFGSLIGWIDPQTAETDDSGVARSSIASPGVEGITPVSATVVGAEDHVQVRFTHVDNPPTGPETELGRLKALMLVGDPVHAGLGNYVAFRRLFSLPGRGLPVQFEALYNSLDAGRDGPLGFGWTHTYNVSLTSAGFDATIRWGDGHQDHFRDDGAGNWTPNGAFTPVKLSHPDADTWEATLVRGVKYRFDAAGRLVAIIDPNGNQLTLTHTTQLDEIVDTAGRRITFTYAASRISSITVTSGPATLLTVAFQYDGDGNLTAITDARGQAWRFTYDTAHRIVTAIDAKGVTVLTNAYDAAGRIAQQTDGAGHVTTYEYTTDASGTKVKITPPSGHAVWQHYDQAHNLTKVIDGAGQEANFASSAQGRIVAAIDKAGVPAQVRYDADGNPTAARDRTGADTTAGFQSPGRADWLRDPLGNTTSFTYDARGNLTAVQNPRGHRIELAVDPSGLVTSAKDFGGNTWSYGYDANGLPRSTTDPTGATTTFTRDLAGRVTRTDLPIPGVSVQAEYDASGLLTKQTDPLGRETTFTYDANGNLQTRTFVPTGAVTSYTYDWAGRLVEAIDPMGGTTRMSYDADGNLRTVTDPDGVTTTYEYDAANRLVGVVNALGRRLSATYDANGRIAAVQNAAGNTWRFTYDAEGRLTGTTDPAGNTQSRVYDTAGRVTRIVDARGHAVAYAYDGANNLASVTFPDGGTVVYTNDPNGRPTFATDPLGHRWRFFYDNAGRLVARTNPNSETERYTYDNLSRLTAKTLRDGTVITYTYDGASRLASVTIPGQTITFGYDAAGNLTSITDSTGTTTMTYDLAGRRLSRTDPWGNTVSFTYTPAGRLRTVTYPGNATVTYAYDAAGKLVTVTDWLGNVTTYEYDAADRMARIVLPNGTRTEHTYDVAGRLGTRTIRKSDGTVLASYTYGYDGDGRLASVERNEPVAPRLADESGSYTYDPVNRMLTANVNGAVTTFAFDTRGNLTTKTSAAGTTTYTYDAVNRLISVADGVHTTTYAYDGNGDRITKTYDGTTTRYVREGGTIYWTFDGAGNILTRNVYAGPLLYSIDASGAMRVYHADERGSVVAVTDALQNVVRAYSYDPYGRVVGSTGSLASPFQYVGTHGVLADENGLYHMQARYYDPEARRFITEDPLGIAAGFNLYAYVAGDPVNMIDPEGLDADRLIAFDLFTEFYLPDLGPASDVAEQRAIAAINHAIAQGEVRPEKLMWRGYPAYFSVLPPPRPHPLVVNAAPPLPPHEAELNPIYGAVDPLPQFGKARNWDTATNAKLEWFGPGGMPRATSGTNFVRPGPTVVIMSPGGVPQPQAPPSSPGFVQRTLTNWRTWGAGIGANIAFKRNVVRATVSYGIKMGLTDVATLSAGEMGGPVVLSGAAGWFAGRYLQQVNLVRDPGTGKWISLEQAQYETLWEPYYTRPYADSLKAYDPTFEASKSIRQWCREQGFDYNTALRAKPGSW